MIFIIKKIIERGKKLNHTWSKCHYERYILFIFHIQINIICKKFIIVVMLIFSQLTPVHRCICSKILKKHLSTHLPRDATVLSFFFFFVTINVFDFHWFPRVCVNLLDTSVLIFFLLKIWVHA